MATETDVLAKLREERDRYRDFWLRAAAECESLSEKLTELDKLNEDARDLIDAAWDVAASWRESCEARDVALEEERQARDALIRIEVDRLTGREHKPRGRPPLWSPDTEAECERLHRAGRSIRQIAAELHVSKTQVHRVITRVRRQQAEAAEHGRLAAIADGRSPAQRAVRAAKQIAERRPIQDYDPVRAERGLEYLRNLPDDDGDD